MIITDTHLGIAWPFHSLCILYDYKDKIENGDKEIKTNTAGAMGRIQVVQLSIADCRLSKNSLRSRN